MQRDHWTADLPARLRRWADLPDSSDRRRRIIPHVIVMAEAVAADATRTERDLDKLRTACCFACITANPSPCRAAGDCPLHLDPPD